MEMSSIEHVDLTNEQEDRASAGAARVQIVEPAVDNESLKFATDMSHRDEANK